MCNSLYYGISPSLISKLQTLQNSAARVIYGRGRRDDVTDILTELHWLPVKDRIHFKIMLFVHKCVHNNAPHYLQNLIVVSRPDTLLLSVPKILTKFGTRAFSFCGPKLWNSLHVSLRTIKSQNVFKRQLKHMFFSNRNAFYNKLYNI